MYNWFVIHKRKDVYVKMGLIKEFKEFAFKGNVMDMAVGVIIGGAFTAVVTGVVTNILEPVVQLIMNHSEEGFEVWKASLLGNVSALISSIVSFFITALVLFLIIKGIKTAETKAASLKKSDEPAPAPTTKVCPYCLSEVPVAATKCAHCTSNLAE